MPSKSPAILSMLGTVIRVHITSKILTCCCCIFGLLEASECLPRLNSDLSAIFNRIIVHHRKGSSGKILCLFALMLLYRIDCRVSSLYPYKIGMGAGLTNDSKSSFSINYAMELAIVRTLACIVLLRDFYHLDWQKKVFPRGPSIPHYTETTPPLLQPLPCLPSPASMLPIQLCLAHLSPTYAVTHSQNSIRAPIHSKSLPCKQPSGL